MAVFVLLGVLRDRRFWLAAAIWLGGFEAVFQFTVGMRLLVHSGFHPDAWWAPVVMFGTLAVGVMCALAAVRIGVRPSLPLLGLTALFWGIWLLTGFHVNEHDMVGFDPVAEALNETAKTLWAAAYLLPLWKATERAPVLVGLRSRL
jgi:xanthosine utilization system XapX-like protein